MKQSICIFLLLYLVFSFEGFGQIISYSYDNAGNRIKKEIIISQQRISSAQVIEESNQTVTDMLDDKFILIHTDPAKGIVIIEIVNLESGDIGMIHVYCLGGQLITSLQITSGITDLDLSNCPNGIYILNIQLNGISSTWKVIKQ